MGAGQKLPWRKDITVKTLDKYLPFILEVLKFFVVSHLW